ncbi:MAG: peptidoglycan editing factor PgeF [Oscillospiraceae bacterium]|nr:peptidoglycan editing factor PgeF [Oscillospiraceae bacterium]
MKINSKTMTLNENKGVPFLTYNKLSQIDFIRHAFSTKHGGVSTDEWTSMNFAFSRGDNPENVIENYKIFSDAVGFDYNSLVTSSQDHNTYVRPVTKNECGIGIWREKDMLSVDALITNEPNVTLVTHYADCTPLFFVDTVGKAIGLAHAGWRGTVGRIGEEVIKKMTSLYGTNPKDVVVAIGPAISRCCYEVDRDCAENFYNLKDLDNSKFIFPKSDGKYMIDLLETNRQIVMKTGVKEENIVLSDLCTKCNSDLLWSHRATNGHRGTMCAFMCIEK